MKNLGSVNNAKSVATKEYVDNRVVANPQSSSTPTELEKLTIGGSLFAPRTVIANPTLAGTESALSGIQIGDTKYNMGSQSNIARVESGTTATKAYAAGEYVVVGGQLYRVTASIASGGTFTPGTNVSATSVGNRLQSIETSVNGLGIYRFTKNLSYGDNVFNMYVPVGSSHLVVSSSQYLQIGFMGIINSVQNDSYNYTVAVSTIYKSNSTHISVSGADGDRTPALTVKYMDISSSARNTPIVLEVFTLLGGRMTQA